MVTAKQRLTALTLIAALVLPLPAAAKNSSAETAGLLSIIPGLGQVSNGDYAEGAAWFVASVGPFFVRNRHVRTIGFDIWMYNMFDAYKDADGAETVKNNVFENYAAMFNPLNIVDPFSVGIIGVGVLAGMKTPGDKKAMIGPRAPWFGIPFYGFVGLGEEGLFRGFLYPLFTKATTSPYAGAAISSAAFAAMHLMNPQSFYHSVGGLIYLFAMGMLFCAQTSYNNHDIRHSIFTHGWFDVAIQYGGQPATDTGQILPDPSFQLTIPIRF